MDLVYFGPPDDEYYLDWLERELEFIERSGKELHGYVQQCRRSRSVNPSVHPTTNSSDIPRSD